MRRLLRRTARGALGLDVPHLGEIRDALFHSSLGGFAAFDVPVELGETNVGRRLDPYGASFVVEATHEQGRRFVELGAMIEHSLCMYDDRSSFHNWDVDVLLSWIQAVGAERSTLGSDLGQINNPLPSEAFTKIVGQLLDAGLSEAELRQLVATNPARMLDLAD